VEMKQLLSADPGYLMVEIDLAQAENRVVAYLANEDKMIEAFANGVDLHKKTASLIFNKPVMEISSVKGSTTIGGGKYSERDIGKRANHGLNYGLGYINFALENEIPTADAKRIVLLYHSAYPNIHQWHESIRNQLSKNKTLTTPFGRTRVFMGAWGDTTFQAAYDYVPQSTVGDDININGVNFIYYNQDLFPEVELLNQVHDSVVFQIPISVDVERIMEILVTICKQLSAPITWRTHSFSIPCDVKIGINLNKYHKDDNPNGLRDFKDVNVTTETFAATVLEIMEDVQNASDYTNIC